jgi:hypothetical protein
VVFFAEARSLNREIMIRRNVFQNPWLLLTVCLTVFLASALRCRAADELVYRSPAGVSFRVTAAGLSSIKLGDREIASGGWSAFNAESWFKDGGSGLVKSAKGEQSIAIVDDHHARVRKSGGDLVCTFDYSFDGEDVTISTRIENNHPTAPMNIVGFSGLTFRFDQLPTGLMPVQCRQARQDSRANPAIFRGESGSAARRGDAGFRASSQSRSRLETSAGKISGAFSEDLWAGPIQGRCTMDCDGLSQ